MNGRELADFLDWEFLTADDELVIEARLPDGEEIVYEVERPEGEALGVELEPPTVRRCANRCEFCFIEGLPKGLRKNLYVRDDDYRLSFAYGNFATLSNVKERDIAADPRVPALAALRLGARHAVGSAQGAAQQPARAEHRRAAHAARRRAASSSTARWSIVPGPERRRRARAVARATSGTSATRCSASRSCRWASPSSRTCTPASRWTPRTPGASSTPSSGGRRARSPSAAIAGCSAPTSCICSPAAPLPGAEHYGDFAQIENGVGAVAVAARSACATGSTTLPRLDGKRIGVVTGVSMAPLMPELLDAAHASRRARRSS